MAERNPPSWLQAGSHPADLDRQLTEALVPTEGVADLAGGDLAVTEQATAAMGVTVAAGTALIDGDESASQGVYHVVNDADVDLAVAASDPTNPRVDLVVAQVRDSFYAGADDDWQLAVVTGTPAASPSEPTVPDNAHVLARVDVAASVSSITNANITDRRIQAALAFPIQYRPIEEPWSPSNRGTSASEGSAVAHSGTKTITNPGHPVEVFAIIPCDISKGPAVGTPVRVRWEIEVSFDGGSSWTGGGEITTGIDDASLNNGGGATPVAFLAGTPTGDVVVRLTSRREDAESGTVNANAKDGLVRVTRTS